MSKIILYIATSQDEFIADKNGGVDWMPQSDVNNEMGYEALMERISVIFMGSKSYLQILGFGDWAWGNKKTYVFTSQNLTTDHKNIFFVSEDVGKFVTKLKKESYKDIWLLGGAELVKSFAKAKLIDECIITILPASLGEGIKLELPYDDFMLSSANSLSDGIVQKTYVRKEI